MNERMKAGSKGGIPSGITISWIIVFISQLMLFPSPFVLKDESFVYRVVYNVI